MKRRIYPLRDFLKNESSSGIVLVIAALLGMVIANTSLADEYFSILDYSFEIDVPGIFVSLTVLKLINYAFMTLFFFVVGLEIKRELRDIFRVLRVHLRHLWQRSAAWHFPRLSI